MIDSSIQIVCTTDDKKTMKEMPYPYNLMEAIAGQEYYWNEPYDIHPYDFAPASILRMIDNVLTPRETQVIEMHYRDKMALAAIARVYDLTPERIRQIDTKALRKLSNPAKLRDYASVPWRTWQEERDARIKAEQQLAYFLEHAEYRVTTTAENEPKIMNTSLLSMSIDELDLSVRSWRCLKQAGIDTIGELVQHTLDDISHIRNLGKRSLEEIDGKVTSLGLKFK